MATSKYKLTNIDPKLWDLIKNTDQGILGSWAADCAERVLPYFEKERPNDKRPREAIDALRKWVKDRVFHMADVRRFSLNAHAAARAVGEDNAAKAAARAAGQATATPHVKTHSLGSATYAAKAVFLATGSMEEADKERDWQYEYLLKLRESQGVE